VAIALTKRELIERLAAHASPAGTLDALCRSACTQPHDAPTRVSRPRIGTRRRAPADQAQFGPTCSRGPMRPAHSGRTQLRAVAHCDHQKDMEMG
jgi:hypothetical protein